MSEYNINVSYIEELQNIGNTSELENILDKAKSKIVQGGIVNLVRKGTDGIISKFDQISTEDDLANYRRSVFKYLSY